MDLGIYEIISYVLGALLFLWGGFKLTVRKFIKAIGELEDVLTAVETAYNNDQQFSASELKNIVVQWNEFINSTGFKQLQRFKLKV